VKITVYAVYSSTDGVTPESVNVEADVPDGMAAGEVVALAAGFVDMVAAVPARRPAAFVREPAAIAATAVPACSRTLCGHARGGHSAIDDQGQDVGVGNGACSVCGNADKCRSFVPPLMARKSREAK
jgi:hypothetical protein